MQKRTLGKNGPELTVIGFGSWATGGPWQFGWGPQDDDKSIKAIRKSLEGGINWIDTAAVYGFGHAEEVVSKALGNMRKDVFIATKCGRTWDGKGNNFKNLKPESIRREIEDSLRRLNTDYVDLYQIHWPDTETGTPIEESWDIMKEIKDEGKARFIGVSNFDIELMEKCRKICPIQSLQPPYNLIRRDVENDILPYCLENGIGVIPYSPMQSGLLTGKFDLSRLAADDWRRNNPIYQEPNLNRHLAFVESLRSVAEKKGATVGQIAVNWVLANPAVTSAIVGSRSPQQAEENLRIPEIILEKSDILEIEKIYETCYNDD